MLFKYELMYCQNPCTPTYIDKTYKIIKCTFDKKSDEAEAIYQKAWELMKSVNPHKANDSTSERDKQRLITDALGGILAEYGWYYYINRVFGDIVNFTPFLSSIGQIDLKLSNEKTIEVRSSFPRNGVKFAICCERYNFKNICKYENLYKPEEANKDFFACTLFETQKEKMMDDKTLEIVFYLIGGSTKEMMNNDTIAYNADLVAEDDLVQQKTNYRVIKLKDALDIQGFENYLESFGYSKVCNSDEF